MHKKLLTYFFLLLSLLSSVYSTTITYSSNYGLENILFFIYNILNLLLWIFIFFRTKPVKIDENNLLSSAMNATFRVLCYGWFLLSIYMSKAILLISSSSEFLDDKLFIYNMGYYITFFFVGLFVVLVLIKHFSKISGVSDFLEAFMYELKNE